MAPASPMSTTTTLLRQSVVVSPSDRFRGGLSRKPTWVVVHQNLAAGSKSPRRHSTPQTTFRFCPSVSHPRKREELVPTLTPNRASPKFAVLHLRQCVLR